MAAVKTWGSPRFTEAVLVWTPYGSDVMPRRDDAAVISHFGAQAASELLPALRSKALAWCYTFDFR